ncbi:UTP--glucose-1-phosphate uridylyltransferase [Leptospira sp. GIMC2001]|uniref:UTP--glucose-1-phosphate uridylyltransferase n=1 Tax=Leptospira sp. GIMC2001 TaxID=1513297 RepID=UPI00234A0C52|nr:UTP--glucose-1-phosphate uridylyltransferase [Leptospira sp. GIMC2001]WCL47698.1 UTP--glucose-1-phosphate uridylyltransferase [Leptospira sp. GIMC2001]
MESHEIKIKEKMEEANLSPEFIEDFLSKVSQVKNGETGIAVWKEVGDLIPEEDEITYEQIRTDYSASKEDLSKLVIIKLNGGLGTSMGLSKAKSLIPIKNGLSFLKIIANQVLYLRQEYGVEIPLLLMDSFNTQADSQEELKSSGISQSIPTSFLQHKVPRLLKNGLTPISCKDPKEDWCPPGHGDIYFTLVETGILDELLSNGYEIAFLSNGDNLGATVDTSVVNFMLKNKLDFAMEMTPKTLADKKGGAIYRKIRDGKFLHYELLETAQVPPEFESEFTGMGKFRTFSTNNLWINLHSLKERWNQGKFRLSLIVNPKKVEAQDVIQIETAMGSAVGSFPNFKGIIIPRDRFAPVKKTEDYLVRRSDAYDLNEDYSLTMPLARKKLGLGEPIVELDDAFYKKINDYDSRFVFVPSLFACESLLVKGDWLFDIEIQLKGKVTFENSSNVQIKISSLGKLNFENETISR